MAGLESILGSSYILSQDKPIDVIQRISNDSSREQVSFYVLSIDELVRRVKLWHLKLPRVFPHYAVKCNDHPAVIKTLALLGTGFDCASRVEIQKVLSAGVSADKIVYAHPCKLTSHLKYAKAKGVKPMTFDSEQELYKIASVFPEAELLIRIRCDAAEVQCQLGIKFGVLPEEARSLLTLAASLSLNVVGVAFHVGSGCSEPSVFDTAITAAKQVFDEAKEEGHSPSVLDIGGGFLGGSVQYLYDAASYINPALEEHFPEGSGVRIIAEPGRYMVANAFTLATPVINFRDTKIPANEIPNDLLDSNDTESVSTRMYFIDDGLYGSFNCVLYDHQAVHPIPLNPCVGDGQTKVSSVWGPTCDGFDQVMKAVRLPELSVGDWLTWETMGAYTRSAAGNFNGFSAPGVKVIVNSHTSDFLLEKLNTRDSEHFRNEPKTPRTKKIGRNCLISPFTGMAPSEIVQAKRMISELVDGLQPLTLLEESEGYLSSSETDFSEEGEK